MNSLATSIDAMPTTSSPHAPRVDPRADFDDADSTYAVFAQQAYQTSTDRLKAMFPDSAYYWGFYGLALSDWNPGNHDTIQAVSFNRNPGTGPSELVISFRGTATVTDWITDWNSFASGPTAFHEGQASAAVVRAWGLVRYDVLRWIDAVKPDVVTVTGHSLGSALATVALIDIAETALYWNHQVRVQLVAFACYPVIDARLLAELAALPYTTLRGYRNADDPINMVRSLMASQFSFVDIPNLTDCGEAQGHDIAGYVAQRFEYADPIVLSTSEAFSKVGQLAINTGTGTSTIYSPKLFELAATPGTGDVSTGVEQALAQSDIVFRLDGATAIGPIPTPTPFMTNGNDVFAPTASKLLLADLVDGLVLYGPYFEKTNDPGQVKLDHLEVVAEGRVIAYASPAGTFDHGSVVKSIRSRLRFTAPQVQWTPATTGSNLGTWGEPVVLSRPLVGLYAYGAYGRLLNLAGPYLYRGVQKASAQATHDQRGTLFVGQLFDEPIAQIAVRWDHGWLYDNGISDIRFGTVDGASTSWLIGNTRGTETYCPIPTSSAVIGFKARYSEIDGITDVAFAYIPWA